jgi:hypothetical protein
VKWRRFWQPAPRGAPPDLAPHIPDPLPRPAPSVAAEGARSAAAGANLGAAATGNHATAVHHQTELALTVPSEAFRSSADIDARPGLGSVPDRPRFCFGRGAELLAISRAFEEGEAMQVLCGLGGAGKTTLAAEWAVRHTAGYGPVWWIDGGSAESITRGLADVGVQLQDTVAKLFSKEGLFERAKQWLLTHRDWLLVLDDVDNPDDVRFLKAIAPDQGRVLITTRLAPAVWHDIAAATPVPLLSEPAAVELFTSICSEKGERDTAGVAELCAELGYLALAIQQAAAYCVLWNMTAPQYLTTLAEAPDATHQAPYEGHQLRRTMAGVWEPSLDRLRDTPLAGDVLRTLAWFPQDDCGPPMTSVPRAALTPLGDPPSLLRALGRLAAHSLVGLDPEFVHVHRVVQAVARTPRQGSVHRSPEQIEAARARAEMLFGGVTGNGSRPRRQSGGTA